MKMILRFVLLAVTCGTTAGCVPQPKVCINPLCLPILSTDDLESAIPDFNWRTGHSRELLTPDQSRKLKRLWKAFLADNAELLARNAFNRNAGEWNCFGIRP